MAAEKTIILITGANGGIGFDTSYELAATSPNYHVIMTGRTLSKGEQALKEIQARKPQGTLSFIQLDVTDDNSIAAATKQIESEFGRVDVLINNAGILIFGPVNRDLLHAHFNTNLYGPILLTQSLEPLLKKSKDLRIINVSSGLGSITHRLDPSNEYYGSNVAEVYRMTKAALNMLTASQAYDYKDVGGKVWSYCPGFVITNLSGESDRQRRKDMGAESSETSAVGIREIVEGKRDGETDKFVKRYGEHWEW
jgi:NAD(P)-dependent dehydrogenase (short-subunit alcohol dehydrogenase family)